MHRQYVHLIILRLAGFVLYQIPQKWIINNMITSDQSCKIERLARRIKCDRSIFCILAHRLCRRMLMTIQCQIRPNLIGYYNTLILPIYFHRFFNLFSLPHASTWIVRTAEDRHMNMVSAKLIIHIFIIHPHYSIFILLQRTMYDIKTILGNTSGKSHICRAVQQNAVSR